MSTIQNLLTTLIIFVLSFTYNCQNDCSRQICGSDYNQCEIFNTICLCESNKFLERITCTNWSSEYIGIRYYQKTFLISISDLLTFRFVEFIAKTVLHNLIIDDLIITYVCQNMLQTTNILNITKLPKLNSVLTLRLNYNCLQDILGNLNEWLPNVEKIDLQSNTFYQIPKSVSNVKTLEILLINYNKINETWRRQFENLSSLKVLEMSGNLITTLQKDMLYDLNNLEVLIMGFNQISVIPEFFLSKSLNLRDLDFRSNQLTELPPGLFNSTTSLTNVVFDENELSWLPINLFDHLKHLRYISLIYNSFTELPSITSSSLYIDIDFSLNLITVLPIPIASRIPVANSLTLSSNCIKDYENVTNKNYRKMKINEFVCRGCCLDSIKTDVFDGVLHLDLSHNQIHELDSPTMKNLFKFGSINLKYNQITSLNYTIFHPFLYHFVRYLEKIYLHGNPLICDCRLNDIITELKLSSNDKIDAQCTNPLILNGSLLREITWPLLCNYSTNCPVGCQCLVDNLHDIFSAEINCNNLNLTVFPNISTHEAKRIRLNVSHNHIFSLPAKNDIMWYKIISLDLSYNHLKSLDNLSISLSLKNLYLNNNSITFYKQFSKTFSKFKGNLSLAGNPWKCDCNRVDIVLNSPNLIDKLEMSCIVNNTILYTLNNITQLCSTKEKYTDFDVLWVILPITVLVIVASIIAILSYKFRSEILYYMFSKGICLKYVSQENIDKDKVYDAFISHSSEDEDWVTEFLVQGLENSNPPYKLCLHGRDWPAGVLITDQIIKSVESSRRTIIVLTDNFLKSMWSRLEFDVAYQQTLKDHMSRLIVVVPGDVPDMSQTEKEFRSFITLTTYIQTNKPYFWRKLKASMPRNKSST